MSIWAIGTLWAEPMQIVDTYLLLLIGVVETTSLAQLAESFLVVGTRGLLLGG